MNMEITRDQAERLVRDVIRKHLGEPMTSGLFKDSVDQVMREVNGKSFEDIKQDKLNIIEG